MVEKKQVDYSLNNPETLAKYNAAADVSRKVLAAVKDLCVAGAKVVDICQKGDDLLLAEVEPLYPDDKKLAKGFAHPTTVSPAAYVTPYAPLSSDAEEAATELKAGEPVKIQLGAQIDGFGTIVCETVIVPGGEDEKKDGIITGRTADLLLATHYANEALLRLLVPAGVTAKGSDEEIAKAKLAKAPTQTQINAILAKIGQAYDTNVVESTTSWLFDRNEIEGKKKIVLAPTDGTRGEGVPAVQEVWGVEMAMSLKTGKCATLNKRSTLHRRTLNSYGLKRATSRKTYSEAAKKFGTFPFSLRQLENERDAKAGVVECVRGGLFRQYELVGDKDEGAVARVLTTVVITDKGVQRLAGPEPLDLSKVQSDKKIEDEEVLKLLEQPLEA